MTDAAESLTLVAVGAILVASVQLSFLPFALDETYRGPASIPVVATLRRGEEMGFFQHGSTIVVLTTSGVTLEDGLALGQEVRTGQRLLRHVQPRMPGHPVSHLDLHGQPGCGSVPADLCSSQAPTT